jgi:hypothetical protein
MKTVAREPILFGCGVDPEFQENLFSPSMETAARMLENALAEDFNEFSSFNSFDLDGNGTPGKREYFLLYALSGMLVVRRWPWTHYLDRKSGSRRRRLSAGAGGSFLRGSCC